jgi:hypothetical protein
VVTFVVKRIEDHLFAAWSFAKILLDRYCVFCRVPRQRHSLAGLTTKGSTRLFSLVL